jgi:hypothetical protein
LWSAAKSVRYKATVSRAAGRQVSRCTENVDLGR